MQGLNENFRKYKDLIILDIEYLGQYFVTRNLLETENITFEEFLNKLKNGTYVNNHGDTL